MTKESLAAQLNGRQYTEEITPAEEKEAAQNGLLVMFGASDDLCELHGAINDEVDAYNGKTVSILNGALLGNLDDDDAEVLKRHGFWAEYQKRCAVAIKVKAVWCATKDYSWTFETDVPHATFDVLEDDGKYCRGIVIDLKESK